LAAPSLTYKPGATGAWKSGVIGQPALGRDIYLVAINALDTPRQWKDFQTWQNILHEADVLLGQG
jgi:hypothetical protein